MAKGHLYILPPQPKFPGFSETFFFVLEEGCDLDLAIFYSKKGGVRPVESSSVPRDACVDCGECEMPDDLVLPVDRLRNAQYRLRLLEVEIRDHAEEYHIWFDLFRARFQSVDAIAQAVSEE
jgi:hypothetical protein